jgi:integrase/recombinase XerD
MSLYGPSGGRKYLNAAERRRFIKAANRAEPSTRLFCLVLGWSGEVLALTPAAIDIERGAASIKTLKRRKRGVVRQVPLPRPLLAQLDRTFRIRRSQRDPDLAIGAFGTGAARPRRDGSRRSWPQPASPVPKGLRHGFGVNAFQSSAPPHLVQRWLGHATLRTRRCRSPT